MSFEIVTDSTSNLSMEDIQKNNIHVISLSYFVDGKEFCSHEKWLKKNGGNFYKMMREKRHMTSSLPPYSEYAELLSGLAKRGRDILYVGFSSAVSGTFHTVNLFLSELCGKYPNQKILSVDSLSISSGEGVLVDRAVQLRAEGKDIVEVQALLEKFRLRICHEFTVDDLFYMKRGGRISATAAIAGSLLQMKPILRVSNEGKPEIIGKVRGRKAAMNQILQNMEKHMKKGNRMRVYICHADCLEDTKYLAAELTRRFGITDIVTQLSDPVVGIHTGPGAIGVFFAGTGRS